MLDTFSVSLIPPTWNSNTRIAFWCIVIIVKDRRGEEIYNILSIPCNASFFPSLSCCVFGSNEKKREREGRKEWEGVSQYGGHHAATWWRAVHTAGTPWRGVEIRSARGPVWCGGGGDSGSRGGEMVMLMVSVPIYKTRRRFSIIPFRYARWLCPGDFSALCQRHQPKYFHDHRNFNFFHFKFLKFPASYICILFWIHFFFLPSTVREPPFKFLRRISESVRSACEIWTFFQLSRLADLVYACINIFIGNLCGIEI